MLIDLARYSTRSPVAPENSRRTESTTSPTNRHRRYWLVQVLTGLGRHEVACAGGRRGGGRGPPVAAPALGTPKSVALIGALTVYAERLDRIGRLDEALTATAEYTVLWRRRSEPIAYAAALDELGRRLAAVGRHRDAEVQYGRTLAIVRDLPPSRWNRRALAAALTNYAIRLGTLGRHREAEVAAAEAVRTHREVVAATRAEAAENEAKRVAFRHSDEYEGHIDWAYDMSDAEERRQEAAEVRTTELNLCTALVNHSSDLHRLRRLDESYAAITEAVGLERARRPEADGHLATALNSLSVLLTDLHRPADAVAAAEESVATYERLADAEDGLAMARNSLGAALLSVGRLDEALAASTAALDAYRRFASDQPARFDGRLADALGDHGRIRSARGEHADAATATAESVAIFRRLAEADPGRYDHECARALRVFAEVRLIVGADPAGADPAGPDLAAARAAAGEAVDRYERLVARMPEAYGPDLERARTVRDAL